MICTVEVHESKPGLRGQLRGEPRWGFVVVRRDQDDKIVLAELHGGYPNRERANAARERIDADGNLRP